MKIAIVNWQDAAKAPGAIGPGMDGGSIISRRLVPKGGQARLPGVKTALQTVNMQELADTFSVGGKSRLMLPAAGGGLTTITGDEDLILSLSDLKNAGLRFDGMNKQQIEDAVREFIAGGGIYYNRTMEDANGKIKWVSGQMAQLFGSDSDLTKVSYRAALSEFARAGTLQGALSSVFADQSELRDLIIKTNGAALQTPEAQKRIAEYRQSIIANLSAGNIMIPRGLNAMRAMAAPYIMNAVVQTMKNVGSNGELLPGFKEGAPVGTSLFESLFDKDRRGILEGLTIKDNEVLFQKMAGHTLGISRYP